MNRQVWPSALFPLRGDVSAEAGQVLVTVIGLQTRPVVATLPTDQQVLVYIGANSDWEPSGVPASGTSGSIQYNNAGVLAGSASTITSAGSITVPSGQTLDWNADTGLSRLGAASLALGNGTAGDFTGSLKLTTVNAITGYQVNSGATSGHVLRGDGTNFVDAQLQYSDLGGTPTINTWAGLTGVLTNGQVIPYGDAGISRLGAASLALGNGTAADVSGTLSLANINLTTQAAPTSVGTAGKAGQIRSSGTALYFCSVTGAAGAAVWNVLTMVPV